MTGAESDDLAAGHGRREGAGDGRRGLLEGISQGMRGPSRWLQNAGSPARALIAFVAGAASVLAMPPFFLWPVLFLTLPVLVWLIDTADRSQSDDRQVRRHARERFDRDAIGRASIAGWFFGLGYFIFGLFWVGEAFLVEADKFGWLLPAAVTMLPAGLALFYAAAAGVAGWLWVEGWRRVLLLAGLFGIAEWLRGHVLTGLPWNTLGYALTPPGALMQSAGLIGIYGLTVLCVVVFAAPLVLLSDVEPSAARSSRRRTVLAMSGLAAAAGTIAGLWGYGQVRLSQISDEVVAGVKLRIVQPSVAQRDKWVREKQREIFDLHLQLTRDGAEGHRGGPSGITHVVWPEAAMPFLPLEHPEALKAIGDVLPQGTFLITGALRVERPSGAASDAAVPRHASPSGANALRVYNSMMVFGSEGGLNSVYDKIHLVPFGEYLPLQNVLEAIGLEQLTRVRGGFKAGRTPRPIIDVPGLPPLVGLVCYEAIFPAAVVQGDDRPGLLINVTNDGWFGNTTGPRQHLHKARVRAVEEGLPLVRAANNGISALIDPAGRVLAFLDMDVRGVVDTRLPIAASAPLYARFGDALFAVLATVALVFALLPAVNARQRQQGD